MTSESLDELEDSQSQMSTKLANQSDSLLRVSIAHLVARYGLVLDGHALVEVLRYPSLSALERSMQRGQLRLNTLKLPNRRGVFVHAQELAQYLVRASESEPDESEESQTESPKRARIEKGA